MDDVSRKNNALWVNSNTVNDRTADIAITTRGSDLYFAISAAMGLSGCIFLALAYTKPRQNRLFHYITAGVVFVASIAYFTMGSNLGFTPIEVEFFRNRSVVRGRFREIFYVRYIDWFITTPLLLVDLLLTAGLPWPKILWVVLVDWIMIVMGLVGALVVSRYKWAYFAIGCAALFYIIYELLFTARRHASLLGSDIHRAYVTCGVLTLFLWILYPIAWGLCEGGNYIAPDSEAIFYSVLDFLAKPCFGALLLWGHRNIDPARLGVQIRDYDEDPAVYAGLHGRMAQGDREKVLAPGAAGAGRTGQASGGVQEMKDKKTTAGGARVGLRDSHHQYSQKPDSHQATAGGHHADGHHQASHNQAGHHSDSDHETSGIFSPLPRPPPPPRDSSPTTWAQIAASPAIPSSSKTAPPADFPPEATTAPKATAPPPDFPPGTKPVPKASPPTNIPKPSKNIAPRPTPSPVPFPSDTKSVTKAPPDFPPGSKSAGKTRVPADFPPGSKTVAQPILPPPPDSTRLNLEARSTGPPTHYSHSVSLKEQPDSSSARLPSQLETRFKNDSSASGFPPRLL